MNKREKILATLVLGIPLVIGVGVGVKRFLQSPLKLLDGQIAAIRDKQAKVAQERKDYFTAEDQLKRVAQRAFGDDAETAAARSGAFLSRAIAQAGLNETDFTRMASGTRRLRGGATEVGWTVQGKGDLKRLMDLLFLLQTTPHLRRVENISFNAYDKPGDLKVRFVFLTLVLDPPPFYDPVELKPGPPLDSPERLAYQSIVERDLLRPYLKRPPSPPPPAPSAPSVPPGPALDQFQIVSLSEWLGTPEVHVRHLGKNETLVYKPGDDLLVGRIVAVDYRPIPLPRNPDLISDSRLILKSGEEYWAVERGETLARRRKLTEAELPAGL